MDPLQSTEATDNSNGQSAIITIDNAGDIRIQLEGSHNTSTDTESPFGSNRKNVTFEDEISSTSQCTEENITKSKLMDTEEKFEKQEIYSELEEHLRDVKIIKVGREPTVSSIENQQQVIEFFKLQTTNTQNENASVADQPAEVRSKEKEIETVSAKSKEITQCFAKIVDIFDNFSRNVETLDKSRATEKYHSKAVNLRKSNKNENLDLTQDQGDLQKEYQTRTECPDSQVALTYDLSCPIAASTSCTDFIDKNHVGEFLIQQETSLEKAATKSCSISIATSSCEIKSFGCQTQYSDGISLNDLSLIEGSSLTSRCGQPNSLNNYAQAENACVSVYGSQQEIIKKPFAETINQQPLRTPADVQDSSIEPPFSVITIEANSRPSSTDLGQRPTFCNRLWDLIGDFCAATFLCLQVNRDCIFCMGFFAAFVVSASFLTAFFYHTLIVNPTLWQTVENI